MEDIVVNEDITILCERCCGEITSQDMVINGTAGNIAAIFSALFVIIMLLIPGARYYALLSLLVLGVRAYSWLKYERYLK
jgi:hypothetical protein